MQLIIERMVRDFERGRLTRRQLAASLAALVTGAQAAPKPSGLRAVSLNHVTVRVPTFTVRLSFTRSSSGCRSSSIRRPRTSWA